MMDTRGWYWNISKRWHQGILKNHRNWLRQEYEAKRREKYLLTNHNRGSLSLKMVQQIPSFASHFCTRVYKHDFGSDPQEMLQAHANLKRTNPLPWSYKLFCLVLKIDESLLNFTMTWNRVWRVALMTKPWHNGLERAVGTAPSLRETKQQQ